MWTTQPSSNALTGLLGEAKAFIPQEREHVGHHQYRAGVFDDESCPESDSNLVAKEIGVVVANIDQFLAPATNRFLESAAANGIAGFLFSKMHVKEKGLVKLRSKFALQGFHSSVSAATQSELSQYGSCGGTATIFRSHFAISHPFGSIQPGAAGFDWSSMTLLLKGTPAMCVSVYLFCNTCIAGENLQKFSEIGFVCHECWYPLRFPGDWNVLPSELARPNQRRDVAHVTWKSRALLED